jgi:hypothetical protein
MLEQSDKNLELPPSFIEVLDHFRSSEFATFTKKGQMSVVPVIPLFDPAQQTVLTTTAVGIPQKAYNVRRNPRVSMLLSEPFCSGLTNPPAILMQGFASISEDLEAKRLRKFEAILREKVPGQDYLVNPIMKNLMAWYFIRLFIDMVPYRLVLWPNGDFKSIPQVLGPTFPTTFSPEAKAKGAIFHTPLWSEKWSVMANRYASAILTIKDPEGFPFSYRCRPRFDSANRAIIIEQFSALPTFIAALPVDTEATILYHRYGESMKQTTMAQFQLRGTLQLNGSEVVFTPQEFIPGFNSKKFDQPTGLEKLTANIEFIVMGKRKTKQYLKKRTFAIPKTEDKE